MAKYISTLRANGSSSAFRDAQLNNQVVISGNNESYSVTKGIFFVEHVEAVTGTTIVIEDGLGNTIASGISYFASDRSPIRCDYGITITGNVAMLKGFIVEAIYP